MTRPINLYVQSRIREEEPFRTVEQHKSQREKRSRIQHHEIDSVKRFTDGLIRHGVSLCELDGFFYGFHIPRIGKEFDLLKFSETACVNIELKSEQVPEEQIRAQLLKNRHYLSHLGKRLFLFTVVTDTLTCYRLSLNDTVEKIGFEEIVSCVRKFGGTYIEAIDELFRASQYLISPLTTPDKFIQGEYFLTQAQDRIKETLLTEIGKASASACFHLTGDPGTGKTLLLYDVAKTLSANGKTAILHCGAVSPGQERIHRSLEHLDIISVSDTAKESFSFAAYPFLLVDETHRIEPELFQRICRAVDENGLICVFCSDPEQILSTKERENDIIGKIRALPLKGEYILSEKIRANKELSAFIRGLKNRNHKPKEVMRYSGVSLNYADTTKEAQELLGYYRNKGYVFINYTQPLYRENPYAIYEEDFDTHHVIGREFDKVVMVLDSAFYYDEHGVLQGVPLPDPDYLYPNLFYQGVTRVREQLSLIVVRAPELFTQIVSLLE